MKVMTLDNLFFEELTNNRRYETTEREIEQIRADQIRSEQIGVEEIRKKQKQMQKYIHSNYNFKYMSKRTPLMSSNYQDK